MCKAGGYSVGDRRAKRTGFIDTMRQKQRQRETEGDAKSGGDGSGDGGQSRHVFSVKPSVVTEGRFDTTDNPNSEMHSGRSFA